MAKVPPGRKHVVKTLVGTARFSTARRNIFANVRVFNTGKTEIEIEGIVARDRIELAAELKKMGFTDLIYAMNEDKSDF